MSEQLKHLSAAQVFLIASAAEARHPESPVTVSDPRFYGFTPSADVVLLQGIIAELSDDALVELGALMWWGRGDDFATFDDAKQHAAMTSADPGYIAAKAPLAKYLRTGYRRLICPDLVEADDTEAA